MAMVPLQYVGKQERYEDPIFHSGSWRAREVKKIDRAVAAHMLWHADVWRDARTAAARKKDPIKAQVPPRKYPKVDPTRERVEDSMPIHLMSQKGLLDFAKSNYNRVLDASKPVEALRAEVRTLMRLAP